MVIRPETWLEVLLGSPQQTRLLRVLARDPAKSWTEREAAAEAGLAPSTANVAFKRLYETGLLEVRRAGRSHLVRLHTDYEVVRRLIDILRAEASTLDRALEGAAKRLPPGVAVYLFGSTARGDPVATSDIDVFVAAADSETADAASNVIRNAIHDVLPARVEVVAVDRQTAKDPRYKGLLDNVRRDGRRLTRRGMEDVLQ